MTDIDDPWEPPLAGTADLLREAVDGRVGEDPPARWHAQSGSTPSGR